MESKKESVTGVASLSRVGEGEDEEGEVDEVPVTRSASSNLIAMFRSLSGLGSGAKNSAKKEVSVAPSEPVINTMPRAPARSFMVSRVIEEGATCFVSIRPPVSHSHYFSFLIIYDCS